MCTSRSNKTNQGLSGLDHMFPTAYKLFNIHDSMLQLFSFCVCLCVCVLSFPNAHNRYKIPFLPLFPALGAADVACIVLLKLVAA